MAGFVSADCGIFSRPGAGGFENICIFLFVYMTNVIVCVTPKLLVDQCPLYIRIGAFLKYDVRMLGLLKISEREKCAKSGGICTKIPYDWVVSLASVFPTSLGFGRGRINAIPPVS